MTKSKNIGRIAGFFIAYFSVAGIAAAVTLPGANLADVLMTDVSYGSLFIKEGISHPFTNPDIKVTCAAPTIKTGIGT